MKKFLSILLCALLMLVPCAALAEASAPTATETPVEDSAPAASLYDLTVALGTKSYTFPMSIEDCKAAGLNVPEFNPLPENRYYDGMKIDNGRSTFKIRVESVGGEHWATGITVALADTPAATVGGFAMGKLTRADLSEMLGEPASNTTTYVRYNAFGDHLIWYFYFENEDASATVNKIEARSTIPSKFGTEFTAAEENEVTELPDVSSMAFNEVILNGVLYPKGSTIQDLLDNGWVLPLEQTDTTIDAGGLLVFGYNGYLYNGSDLIWVGAYNYSPEEVNIAKCVITKVNVYGTYGTEMILADGITFGSELSAAEATLGASTESEEAEAGTTYRFKVLGNVEYELVYRDGALYGILVDGLN